MEKKDKMEKQFKYAELNAASIFGSSILQFSALLISVKTDLALRSIIKEWQKHTEDYNNTYKKIQEQAKAEFPKAFDPEPCPKQTKKMSEKYDPMVKELGDNVVTFTADAVDIDADELQAALEKNTDCKLTTPHYIAVEDFIRIK